jgi:hypothetical protein
MAGLALRVLKADPSWKALGQTKRPQAHVKE